jgi:predicted HTH transcriptional regulator
MKPLRIFISSVQKEFAPERAAVRDYLRSDPLLRRFFEPFLFEDMPAVDRRADELYLEEVAACNLYLGLFGNEYGVQDSNGISPTQREFDEATRLNKYRIIFIKGTNDQARHVKIHALINSAGNQLVRRRFNSLSELITGIYSALVHYLVSCELIRSGPFDAAPCPKATLADMDEDRMEFFVRHARKARGFPLHEDATPEELLTHLNLFDEGQLTHAAVLLFAKHPQRFLISSEVKCAHFHGTEVAKPIPSYQVYKGTVFELVDQAVDFVMSKINLKVGTRKDSPQVPVEYELPREVVTEAIVNAVAHRDYSSAGSVQVMLFSDRLEVWNPGTLPPTLTLAKLRLPHGSVPGNPLLAEPLYLAKYIERMGTGTGDMIRRCREVGLPEPEFSLEDGFVFKLRRKVEDATGQVAGQVAGQVTGQVTGQVEQEVQRLLLILKGEMSRQELQDTLALKGRDNFEKRYLKPALDSGYIEYTVPEKPQSRMQKYRLTKKWQAVLKTVLKGKKDL